MVILSGPIVGVIVGGNIVNRYGGYIYHYLILITIVTLIQVQLRLLQLMDY